MNKTHTLKTDIGPFSDIYARCKTVEIRENDRGFKVGDSLILRETCHTGKEMAEQGLKTALWRFRLQMFNPLTEGRNTEMRYDDLTLIDKLRYGEVCGDYEGETNICAMENVMDEAADTIEALQKDKAELVEAVQKARIKVYKSCNDAVDLLRAIDPDRGWDDGDKTAEIHLRDIDPVLAKHTPPKGDTP